MKTAIWLALGVGCWLWMMTVEASAQIGGRGGSVNRAGSLGYRGGATGAGGLRGRAANPNFNPPGSVSTFQRLNPPGSTSPALNLNPKGSVFRPRIGTDPGQPSAATPNPIRRHAYRPQLVPTRESFELMPRQSLCVWVRSSARQLEGELARFENGSDWKSVLQLSQVREILSAKQCRTLTDEDRLQLKVPLERFNELMTDNQFDTVTQLPGFIPLRRSLTALLSVDNSSGRVTAAQRNEATGVKTP